MSARQRVSWDDAAAAFHERNPHVYAALRDVALVVRASRRQTFGIGAIFERLRWISLFETEGDPYRLNNNYRAWYARRLMALEPTLRGLFVTRESASDPDYHARVSAVRHDSSAQIPSQVGQ